MGFMGISRQFPAEYLKSVRDLPPTFFPSHCSLLHEHFDTISPALLAMSSHEHQTYIGHELAQYRKKQHCGSLVATELMSGISTFRRTRYGHLGAEATDYFLVSTWHISRIHNSKYVG